MRSGHLQALPEAGATSPVGLLLLLLFGAHSQTVNFHGLYNIYDPTIDTFSLSSNP